MGGVQTCVQNKSLFIHQTVQKLIRMCHQLMYIKFVTESYNNSKPIVFQLHHHNAMKYMTNKTLRVVAVLEVMF